MELENEGLLEMFSAAQQLKKIYENTANYCNPLGKDDEWKKGSRKACTEKTSSPILLFGKT